MIIDSFIVGPLQCNCILVGCEKSGYAVVLDPGGDPEYILERLDQHGLKAIRIILTHAHFDHIVGLRPVKEQTKSELYLHYDDKWLYENVSVQSKSFGLAPVELPAIDHFIYGGEIFNIGSMQFKILHTPGHSPGSICLLANNTHSVLFTGDTLFKEGIGRTDLWGGSYETLLQSIYTKIVPLDEKTVIYPGHGPSTILSEEKIYNPFIINS